jgi:hypothetical protein
MGNDLAFVSVDNDIIVGRSHLANRIELITPVTLGLQDVMQIYFELANGQTTPKRSMFVTGSTVNVGGDQFNVYRYDIPQSVLSAITSANSSTLKVQFRKATIGEGEGNVVASGTATAGTSTTLTDSTKTFTTNQYQNFVVFITGGTGAGQKRTIASNTATVLTVTQAWTVTPDTTSTYTIRPITTIAQALITSAQVNLTIDGAIIPNSEDEVIEIDVFDELSGAINDKLNKDFSGFAEKTVLNDADLIAIDEGAGTNKKVRVDTLLAAAVTEVDGLIARVEQVENFVDQDVSIGSNPAFATPTVDGLTFRDNGNTATIDYDDALAINATAGHIADTTIHFTADSVTKTDVGLGNVDNTSDLNKPISTATQTALDGKQATLVSSTNIKTINSTTILGTGDFALIPASEKGANNGVATLDAGGKVPAGQLPSFVDDLEEYANLAAFPATGDSDKIYVALDTNKVYRWSGSQYVEIAANEVNSVNSKTGVVTITAADVGLGNVTNESKATMFTDPTFTGTVTGVTATHVGLGNVTNNAQVTDVTGTAPITSSGGTTPAISISEATGSAAGSMSATDKAKLDALAADTLDTDTEDFDGILSATQDTVQKALDVLDDIDAGDIPYDNTGQNLIATDVQAAINEIDDLVEEGLTQVVVTKYNITDADSGTNEFEYNINGGSTITGTISNGVYLFDLPSGVQYVTGGNRLTVKIDNSTGALKRLFYGADSELSEPSTTSFGVDYPPVSGSGGANGFQDNDALYAKIYQSLATVSIDIADGSITEGKIADGAVTTTKIANSNVTLAKLQDIATLTVLGNDTGGTAAVKALTASETKTLLALNNVDNTTDLNKPISSNTQTALDGKLDKASSAALTANRAVVTDAAGKAVASASTDVEVGHLSGVTSAIQTQIDAKVTGPASAVANRVATFDGTTGKVIKDSGFTIATSVPAGAVFTDTGEVNIIEEVQAEGVALSITGKAVNVTRASLGAGTGDADVFFFTTTIAAVDWTGASAPYSVAKEITGILDTDRPIVDLDLSAVDYADVAAKQADYALIYRAAATDDDEITFFATDEPTEELVIQIKVVR